MLRVNPIMNEGLDINKYIKFSILDTPLGVLLITYSKATISIIKVHPIRWHITPIKLDSFILTINLVNLDASGSSYLYEKNKDPATTPIKKAGILA